MSQKVTDSAEEVYMFTAHPGEIVGGLAVLTGEASYFTIRAKHFTRLALISKTTFYRYIFTYVDLLFNSNEVTIIFLFIFTR